MRKGVKKKIKKLKIYTFDYFLQKIVSDNYNPHIR